jgi:hypothetical protein
MRRHREVSRTSQRNHKSFTAFDMKLLQLLIVSADDKVELENGNLMFDLFRKLNTEAAT